VRLTAENTAIVIDSTADFPEAPERFTNWRIVPLYVRFGDESFRDYVDLGPGDFYARLRSTDELPTTSQPTPADFLAAYAELERYERILSLHISAKLSGTYESARLAAADVGDRVQVIDSESASAAIALLGLAMQRRLEAGTSAEEIDALVERYRRESRLLFTVETLEFLRRGGRIGKASAMAGQLLKVKPILSLQEGEVLPLKRVRGSQKAFAEFVNAFRDQSTDGPGLRVGIAHADAPDRAEALAEMVARERPQAQIELTTVLGAVIGTHAGPGTVGFFWYDDGDRA
jgi:DegV family protein with EDD domain